MIRLIFALAFALLAFAGFPACIYMDARTGCSETEVRVNYAVTDSKGVSMAPSLDYHREGAGGTSTNSSRQDGRLSAVGDAALKAIGETVAACASGGISEAPTAARMLAERLGRDPSAAELAELERQRLPQP